MRWSVVQLCSSAAVASCTLAVPLYTAHLGGTRVEVGLIGTIYGLTLFLSNYLFGAVADRYSRWRVLYLGLGASALVFGLQALATSVGHLAAARGLAGVAAGIFPAALIATVYEQHGPLGRFISWGSLGWSVGFFLIVPLGWLSPPGAPAGWVYGGVFASAALLFGLALAAALRMPREEGPHLHVPLLSLEPLRRNWPIYLSFLIRHTGAQVVWIIFPLYIVSLDFPPEMLALGTRTTWVGLVMGFNVFLQFFMMPRVDRLPETRGVVAGFLLSALSFALYPLARSPLHVLLIQPIIALAWSLLYVGIVKWLMGHTEDKATSSGALASMHGLSYILGPLLGGLLSDLWGFPAAFHLAAALSLAGLLLYLAAPPKETRAPGAPANPE
ncbi:MAG: MFS transporter [Euryarchaeota archaeon]|nr:MFS transporter [Euryarchaeota archaeon]